MAKLELVFDLRAEGGRSSIYRTKKGNGEWEYHVAGGGMYLDEKDREVWSSGVHKPVSSFEEALHSIAQDGFWIYLYPLSIHPQYRKTVWLELHKIVESLPNESLKHWNSAKDRWGQMCLENS